MTEIFEGIGSTEMYCFLAHVNRIENVVKFSKDQFCGSFLQNNVDLLQLFNTHSDQHDCDDFLKKIESYYQIWKKIFSSVENCSAKEALKMLRGDY